MSKPRLSLCMIVRDEEAMLPGFLDAVAGLWDELIAVDTGSQDATAALLTEAGARVVPFAWCDDFAAARNASLAEASGQWILFLDADERVTPALHNQIHALLDDPRAGAATLVMRNRLPGGHRRDSRLLRLFRNDAAIRFRYRIHEDVSEPVHQHLQHHRLELRHLSGVVDHLGYVRSVAADRNKKERDLGLLQLALEQDPDDFYCRFKILELARFWEDQPLWQEEALRCDQLLKNLTPEGARHLRQRPWSGELAALVVQGLGLAPEGSLDWLRQSGTWAAPTAAWLLRRGHLLEETGRAAEAAECYEQCLQSEDEAASQLVGVRPLLGLCRLAMTGGDLTAACDLAARAANLAPTDPEALLALQNLTQLAGQPERWARHLHEHPEAAIPAARTSLRTGQLDTAARLLAPLAGNDPEAALGLLVCTLVRGDDFDFQVDATPEQAGEFLQGWVRDLWQSRDPALLGAFAEGCPAIRGLFPWLPEFLAAETRQLSGGEHQAVSSSRR